MQYEIIISSPSSKYLSKLPLGIKARVEAAIEDLKDNLKGEVKKLVNDPGYRMREGDYRVVFEVEGGIVMINKVAHRRDIYRKG
jgi:mRNA interferase RelE/StbE